MLWYDIRPIPKTPSPQDKNTVPHKLLDKQKKPKSQGKREKAKKPRCTLYAGIKIPLRKKKQKCQAVDNAQKRLVRQQLVKSGNHRREK